VKKETKRRGGKDYNSLTRGDMGKKFPQAGGWRKEGIGSQKYINNNPSQQKKKESSEKTHFRRQRGKYELILRSTITRGKKTKKGRCLKR